MRTFRNIIDLLPKIILGILLSCVPRPISAQEDGAYQIPGYKDLFLNPVSPDVWSMIKYGNAEVNPYSGTVGTSIPIYTYQDDDFTIPISIDYASSGYKPNIPTGVVGLGWYLNVGGVITREIRGIPDDGCVTFNYYSYGFNTQVFDVLGYASLHQMNNLQGNWRFDDLVYTNIEGKDYMKVAYNNATTPLSRYEIEPDIYHFNFLGHTGSFILQPNNRAVFFNCNTPSGDYSIRFDKDPEKFVSFTLTTVDGTQYLFEKGDKCKSTRRLDGWHHKLHHNDTLDEENIELNKSDDGLTNTFSWRLTKIIAPNGRIAEFSYDINALVSYESNHDISCAYIPTVSQTKGEINTAYPGITETYNIKQEEPTVNVVYAGLLQQIRIGNEAIIDLSYSDKPVERIADRTIFTESSNRKQLDSIIVRNRNHASIKRCHLSYKCNRLTEAGAGTGGGIIFLKSIDISGVGVYSMYYNKENDVFPGIDTYEIDWYGYYNGGNTPAYFIPPASSISDLQNDRTKIFNYRKPNEEYAKYGMLEKIAYPTGGYTTYQYESNSWAQIAHLITGYEDRVNNLPNKKTGGLRIKEICDYTREDSLRQRRVFSYTDVNNNDSGQLLWTPEIKKYYGFDFYNTYPGIGYEIAITKKHDSRSSADDRIHAKQHHIEYPQVIEKVYDNQSVIKRLIEYKYFSSTEQVCNDRISFSTDTLKTDTWKYDLAYWYDVNLTNSSLYSDSGLGGKLKSKTYYDQDFEHPLYKEVYKYDIYHEDVYRTSVPIVHNAQNAYYEYDFSSPYLKEMESHTYDQNSEPIISTVQQDSVDMEGRLRSRTTINSKGNTIKHEYDYFNEVPSYLSSHIISNDGCVTAALKYNYKQNSGFYVPSSIEKAAIAPTNTESDLRYYTQKTFDEYDADGRPLQITDKTGKSTCFIWGYGGQYPIAKIENITYDILSQEENITGSYGGTLTPFANNSLRNMGKDIHVTTYTYNPLVGITCIEDPSGHKIYYEYDENGKFIRIKDHNGVPVKSYQYNIATDY